MAYGFQGGYEPGMSSDSGLELGKELTFDYALVPHTGDWRQAAVEQVREALFLDFFFTIRPISGFAN